MRDGVPRGHRYLCLGLLPARIAVLRCCLSPFSQKGISQALSHEILSLWDVSGINDRKKLPWLASLEKCWVKQASVKGDFATPLICSCAL